MWWAQIAGRAYWICFVAVFLAVAVWESLQPKHELSVAAERRWKNHGTLLVIATAAMALVIRVNPVALSVMVSGSRLGVLNKPWMPLIVRCGIAVVLLDLLQYWIHWTYHHAPWLWRIHQVHHSDPDFDVSTSARFHPLEVIYGQAIRLGAIAMLAPPPVAVFSAELLVVIVNLAVHANASLPDRAERALRSILITPDLHRVHHSLDVKEQQLNLGEAFPWWDRLFGTYAARASAKPQNYRAGLAGLENCDTLGLGFMLAEPFRNIRQEDPIATADPLT